MINFFTKLLTSIFVSLGLISPSANVDTMEISTLSQENIQEQIITDNFSESEIIELENITTEPEIIESQDYNLDAPIFQGYTKNDLENIAKLENEINFKKDNNGIDPLLKPEVFMKKEIDRINQNLSKQRLLDLIEKKDYYSEALGFVRQEIKQYDLRKIEELFQEIEMVQQEDPISRSKLLRVERDYYLKLYQLKKDAGDITQQEKYSFFQEKNNYLSHPSIVGKLIIIDEDLGFAMLGSNVKLQNQLRDLYILTAEKVLDYESRLEQGESFESIIANDPELIMDEDSYYLKYNVPNLF